MSGLGKGVTSQNQSKFTVKNIYDYFKYGWDNGTLFSLQVVGSRNAWKFVELLWRFLYSFCARSICTYIYTTETGHENCCILSQRNVLSGRL